MTKRDLIRAILDLDGTLPRKRSRSALRRALESALARHRRRASISAADNLDADLDAAFAARREELSPPTIEELKRRIRSQVAALKADGVI